eukprot:g27332.t3
MPMPQNITKAQEEAQRYVDEHGLDRLVTKLMNGIIAEKPEDAGLNLRREGKWNRKHTILFSRDNDRLQVNMRSYFDRWKDVEGSSHVREPTWRLRVERKPLIVKAKSEPNFIPRFQPQGGRYGVLRSFEEDFAWHLHREGQMLRISAAVLGFAGAGALTFLGSAALPFLSIGPLKVALTSAFGALGGSHWAGRQSELETRRQGVAKSWEAVPPSGPPPGGRRPAPGVKPLETGVGKDEIRKLLEEHSAGVISEVRKLIPTISSGVMDTIDVATLTQALAERDQEVKALEARFQELQADLSAKDKRVAELGGELDATLREVRHRQLDLEFQQLKLEEHAALEADMSRYTPRGGLQAQGTLPWTLRKGRLPAVGQLDR